MTETWMSRAARRWLPGAFVALGGTAADATTATTTVVGPLNVRTGATTKSAVVGLLGNGAKVTLACKVTGELIHGRIRTTNQWDRLDTAGRYVSHAYVRGADSLPVCAEDGGPNGGMTPAQF